MANELSIVSILYLLGAGQGAFLALALFTSKVGSRRANYYLGALTLVFTLALIDYFLDLTGLINQYIWLRTLLWPKEFLYGILIYFYVRELTLPNRYFLQGRQWLHFIPAILHIIITWSLLVLNSERQRLILQDKVSSTDSIDAIWAFILGDFELFLTIFQITIYLLMSLLLLRQHSIRIKQTFSYSEKISLNWLKLLLLGIFVVYLIWLMEELLSEQLKLEATFDMILGLSMVVLIYSMGYLGLRQPLIFKKPVGKEDSTNAEEVNTVSPNPDETDKVKYKSSPLSGDLSIAFSKELEQLMQEEKPYLDNKLSMPQLADQLGISINYLSQIINQQHGKNFFDFINHYRIDEAKKRLANPKKHNENILTVSLESGFNSKSAFYTAFKKHIGMTPSQYRKSLQH